MIRINDKKKCMGCSACSQICPKDCIAMEMDAEGFVYPKVDIEKCIECNQCEKICPVSNHPDYTDDVLAAYAGYSWNIEERMQSSSGGLFSLAANEILNEKGIVFGATLDDNHVCRHVAVKKHEDLYKLRGSKYVQSIIGNSYREIEDYLKKGKRVLFSGTACQCAGLKAFLGKDYEKLLIIDVLCHGVPSPKVFKKYLQNMEVLHDASVTKINFRSKTYSWKDYAVKLIFDNSSEYEIKSRDDEFMQLFLSDICLRPSCHECQFKKLERPSDITLGDAWGIQRTMPEVDDDRGTSVIIIHTQRGMKVFDSIKEKLFFKEMDVDTLVSPYADSRKSVTPHPNRKKFFKRLNKSMGWKELYKAKNMTIFDRVRYKIYTTLNSK